MTFAGGDARVPTNKLAIKRNISTHISALLVQDSQDLLSTRKSPLRGPQDLVPSLDLVPIRSKTSNKFNTLIKLNKKTTLKAARSLKGAASRERLSDERYIGDGSGEVIEKKKSAMGGSPTSWTERLFEDRTTFRGGGRRGRLNRRRHLRLRRH